MLVVIMFASNPTMAFKLKPKSKMEIEIEAPNIWL